MKNKVLLVEPAAGKANVFSFFSYLPLMGPLYLGTILKQNGFDVEFVNENILKGGLTDEDLSADFLLLSCLTPTVNRGYALAKRFKELNPNGKVIMGGPHVTFLKEEAAEVADHVVLGEGESVIAGLLKYGSNEKFIQGSPVEDMDSLPFIDWSIFRDVEKMKIQPIMTSRGCPFACNFCAVTAMFGKKFRAMSAERVIEEVSRTKLKDVFFYDDNFTADKRRANAIMDGMIAGKFKKSWTGQVRVDVVKDPELVEKMAMSGCDRVYIGLESVNPASLKTMKKAQTPEDIKTAVSHLHRSGIKVHGMFIYGTDSDDKAAVAETMKFVKESCIDSVQFAVMTPLPGTEVFNNLESSGRLIHKNWDYYDGLHVVFWPEKFKPFDLQKLSMDSFKSFYSLGAAANEIMNLLGDRFITGYRDHTYSLKNALFKAGGKFLLDKWDRVNKSYMSYLGSLSANK